MAKLFLLVVAAIASFVVVESLSCNKCSFSLLGVCLSQTTETCSVNTSVCFTGRVTFPSLTSFVGFNSQGCRDNNTGCAVTTGSLLGVSYSSNISCCTTDNCNPITLSGAPSTKVTFTAAIGGAVLATMLGSFL